MGYIAGESSSSNTPAPLKKPLSRSLSFRSENDANRDLDEFPEIEIPPNVEEEPVLVNFLVMCDIEGSYKEVAELSTNDRKVLRKNPPTLVKLQHVPYDHHSYAYRRGLRGYERVITKTVVRFKYCLAIKEDVEQDGAGDVDLLSDRLSKSFPLLHADEFLDTKCELWFYSERLPENLYKLRLQVRWPHSDFATLETPDSMSDPYVARYWANGGRAYKYKSSVLLLENIEDGTTSLLKDLKIPHTFDLIPSPQLENPFKLQLFEYQLRTLAWMQGIEDCEPTLSYSPNIVKLNDDYYVDVSEKKFGTMDELMQNKKFMRSGIIADKPGVGKTIIILALYHTRPFELDDYQYTLEGGRLRSRATMIVVPANICEQWSGEIRKCLGDSLKIIQIKGKAQYLATSLKDVLECDIVLISYNFLSSTTYKGYVASGRHLAAFTKDVNMEKREDVERFVNKWTKGDFAFTWIHFHRIVFDEFHEATDKSAKICDQLVLMSGDKLWGLTGTPRLEKTDIVGKFANFLCANSTKSWVYPDFEAYRYILNRVRRNEPEIQYPKPILETIYVRQTPNEYLFYLSASNQHGRYDQTRILRICNHYQTNFEHADIGLKPLTIEEVTAKVQEGRAKEIKRLQDEISEKGKVLNKYKQKIEELRLMENKKQTDLQVAHTGMLIDTNETRTKELKVDLNKVQTQFNFFQNFVDSYSKQSNFDCPICLEDSVKGELGIIPCGHLYCWMCTDAVVKIQRACPTCRAPVEFQNIMKLKPPKSTSLPDFEQFDESDETKLNPNKFGSKIRELVAYLRREEEKDESHRFVIFIQWWHLAELVSSALRTFGIENAQVKGGWMQRERALRMFRDGLNTKTTVESEAVEEVSEQSASDVKGKRKAEVVESTATKKSLKSNNGRRIEEKPVKVLILSVKDSVSGLNLTEASHCIILHPFFSHEEEYAVASEKQGLGRVLRNGQTKTVQIVRFVVENTIEEDMYLRRIERFAGEIGMTTI
ncbi:hypothetical protein HK098_006649 [Nowakowskiella sp. JEL0407]|nr:hypothetical protein HK098_006649 [Nowakowskiella sp. JEL0407]